MATWRNNDREESKPSWLNKAQKRNCVRTVRGWEVPSANAYGNQFDGWKLNGPTAHIPTLELIVAMPTDVTGGTSSSGNAVGPNYGSGTNNWFIRGLTSAYGAGYGGSGLSGAGFYNGGAAYALDLPNYTPYFTCPFDGDSCTAGGPESAGVSHSGTLGSITGSQTYSYRTNKLGVSSLGLPFGVTAYIKVCLNDFNFTQNIGFTAGSQTGFSLYQGFDLIDTAKVPAEVHADFFGPTSAPVTGGNVAVIRFTNLQAATGSNSSVNSATYKTSITLTGFDNSGSTFPGLLRGATSAVRFHVSFDRQIGANTFNGL
jgi:hypothetical protein